MPKTLLEKIVFTVVMAAIMVYGMIVYNVALATGGVTNATFGRPCMRCPLWCRWPSCWSSSWWKSWRLRWPSPSYAPPTGRSSQ